MSRVSQDEFQNWLEHPVTERLRQHLREAQQSLTERWGRGDFTFESGEATLQANANRIGEWQALQFVIDITYEDLFSEDPYESATSAKHRDPFPVGTRFALPKGAQHVGLTSTRSGSAFVAPRDRPKDAEDSAA